MSVRCRPEDSLDFAKSTPLRLTKETQNVDVKIATEADYVHAEAISQQMAESARARGTGIAQRTPEYLRRHMASGHAVIALEQGTDAAAGFCYIESWEDKQYVANSGLIVFPRFRRQGLAARIKARAFELSRSLYPDAKLFGLTTGLAVMRINSSLGYVPVPFSELTRDTAFWNGCKSCINYDILSSKAFTNCLCTGMIFEPGQE